MGSASSLCSYIWLSRGISSPSPQNHDTDQSSTFCDTTMYLYVSEIFPTEIRPIGMGFSLFGQFTCEYRSVALIIIALLTSSSNNHPPPDGPNGLQQRGLEILPRNHLLVGCIHPWYVLVSGAALAIAVLTATQ